MQLRVSSSAAVAAILLTAATPSWADWRDDVGTLRIGVLADAGPAVTRVRLEGFRAFLEGRTELPVELVPARNLAALVDAQVTGRTAYALHSAFSYVDAVARCDCVEPIAAPVARGGASGFHALIVARSSASIDDLEDLAGRRLAVTGPDSVAGYLAPLQALADVGLDPGNDLDELVPAADPADALTMLFTAEADAAVAWSSLTGDATAGYDFGILTAMVAAGDLVMDEIAIVWQSPEIPFGPHVVRADMPAELKVLLADALTSLDEEAPEILDAVDRSTYGGGGFRLIQEDAYGYLAAIVTGGTEGDER